MKDPRRRVILHGFGWEGRLHCHFERPDVSIRSNVERIWFTGQFRSRTMKDSRPRVISQNFLSESYHHCDSESLDVPSCRTMDHRRWQKNDSKGDFEVQQCRILNLVFFHMLFDENLVIIVSPTSLLYQGFDVDQKLIQRAILKYNHERILAPSSFPCVPPRTTLSLIFRNTWFWDSEGDFEVLYCTLMKDLCIKAFSNDLIQRAILKYSYERMLASGSFPCFSMRTIIIFSLLVFRKTWCVKLSTENWFRGQIWNTNAMKEHSARLVLHAVQSESKHHCCYSETRKTQCYIKNAVLNNALVHFIFLTPGWRMPGWPQGRWVVIRVRANTKLLYFSRSIILHHYITIMYGASWHTNTCQNATQPNATSIS